MLSNLIVAAESTSGGNTFPTVIFGAIAMSIFLLLGVVTWSYRDVANRHDHKSSHNKEHH